MTRRKKKSKGTQVDERTVSLIRIKLHDLKLSFNTVMWMRWHTLVLGERGRRIMNLKSSFSYTMNSRPASVTKQEPV